MNTTSTTTPTSPTTNARRRLGVALAGVALAASAVTGAVVASSRDSAAAGTDDYIAVPGYASFGVPSAPAAPQRSEVSADILAKIAEFPPYLITPALLQLANA